jgi:hypothetical protein
MEDVGTLGAILSILDPNVFFFFKLPGLGWGANPGSFDFVYFFILSLYR